MTTAWRLSSFLIACQILCLVKGQFMAIPLNVSDHGSILAWNLTLGSNDQLLEVIMDTGSSEFWVYDSSSFAGGFDSNASTSFSTNGSSFEISYMGGTFASGIMASDELSLLGESVPVTFGLVSEGNAAMGVLGLGPNSSFLSSLYANNLISGHTYTVLFNDVVFGDHVVLGGVDTRQDLQSVPLVGSSTVSIMLHGLGVSNDCVANFSVPALLDTGTTRTHLPGVLLGAIAEAVNATQANDSWVLDCQTYWDLELNFSGVVLGISSSHFMVNDDQVTGQCVLSLQESDDIIIGLDVLRSCALYVDLDSATAAIGQADQWRYPAFGTASSYPQARGYSQTASANITLYSVQTNSSGESSVTSAGPSTGTAHGTSTGSTGGSSAQTSNFAAHPVPQFWQLLLSLYI